MENKEILENEINENVKTEETPEVETIIEVNNVSMEFFLPNEKVDNLKEFFIRLIKGKMERNDK